MKHSTIIPKCPQRINVSRLEPYRSSIAVARQRKLSYRTIVAFLQDQHQVKISHRGLADFCLRRGILKGQGETQIPAGSVQIVSRDEINAPELSQPLPLDGGFKVGRNKLVETWKSTTGTRPQVDPKN